jgi:hypothetical protein
MERIAPLRLAEKWDNVSLRLDDLENQLMNASRLAFCWVRQAAFDIWELTFAVESPVQKPGRNKILLTIE